LLDLFDLVFDIEEVSVDALDVVLELDRLILLLGHDALCQVISKGGSTLGGTPEDKTVLTLIILEEQGIVHKLLVVFPM